MKIHNVCKGLQFYPVPEVDDANIAFGLDGNQYFDRSDRPEVPEKYEDMVNKLFFNGGELPKFRAGVDREAAILWFRAAMGSWAPPHESKVTTVAYALWNWIEGDDDE